MMETVDTLISKANKNETVGAVDVKHVDHCFDYLRNSLLCCGDTALEGRAKDDPASTLGLGAIHVCKNIDEIIRFSEDHRPSDEIFL
jgi:hypothetical protein